MYGHILCHHKSNHLILLHKQPCPASSSKSPLPRSRIGLAPPRKMRSIEQTFQIGITYHRPLCWTVSLSKINPLDPRNATLHGRQSGACATTHHLHLPFIAGSGSLCCARQHHVLKPGPCGDGMSGIMVTFTKLSCK